MKKYLVDTLKKNSSGVAKRIFQELADTDKSAPSDTAKPQYFDGDKFDKSLKSNLVEAAARGPLGAVGFFRELASSVADVQKFSEAQQTARVDILAQRDVIVEKIQSQKEVILFYLEKSFDERKLNFEKLFSAVDIALKSNNIQALSLSLDSINKLAASSPFKALSDMKSTALALTDKSHEWDF
jgi:hypothetical protein